jgi:uncharacterized membrane protein required for colicin V production
MDAFAPLLDYLKDPETPFGMADLVYGCYFIYAFIRGAFKGLPEELANLLGTVLIFFGSSRFYHPVSDFIIGHTRLEDPTASMALAYLLILLVLLLTWKLLTLLIKKALDWTCPKVLKGIGGAVVGLLKSAVIVGVILSLVLISGHQVLRTSMVEESWFGRQFGRLLPDNISLNPDAKSEEPAADGSGKP